MPILTTSITQRSYTILLLNNTYSHYVKLLSKSIPISTLFHIEPICPSNPHYSNIKDQLPIAIDNVISTMYIGAKQFKLFLKIINHEACQIKTST